MGGDQVFWFEAKIKEITKLDSNLWPELPVFPQSASSRKGIIITPC